MKNKTDHQLIMYTSQDGKTKLRIQASPNENTVWLSQKQMSELFDTSRENVTMHIKNVFAEGELDESSVCKDFLLTADDGKNYQKVLTMTQKPNQRLNFSNLFKTKCTMQRMAKLLPN